MSHYALLVVEVTILVLAIFLGFEVISKVPTLLHTPLMSGTNAIHGIVVAGAMLVPDRARPDLLTGWVGFVAMILAAANVVGGFVVTDRMLEMFKKREPPKAGPRKRSREAPVSQTRSVQPALSRHDHLLRAGLALPVVAGGRLGAATGSALPGCSSRSSSPG